MFYILYLFLMCADRIITRATASSISVEGKPGHSRSRESSISKVNANTGARSRDPSSGSRSHSRHRESGSSPRRSGSPRMPRPRSEEIPLEDMKLKVWRELFVVLLTPTTDILFGHYVFSKDVRIYCFRMLPMGNFKLHH